MQARFYNEATNLNPGGTIPPGVPPAFSNLRVTRVDPTVDYDWVGTVQGISSPAPRAGIDPPGHRIEAQQDERVPNRCDLVPQAVHP